MRRGRLARYVGLTVASGALIVACAGGPANLTAPRAGFVTMPFHLPALYAPAPVQVPTLVNQPAANPATDPLKTPATAAQRAKATMQETLQLSMGNCNGH